MGTASAAISGPNCDPMWFSLSAPCLLLCTRAISASERVRLETPSVFFSWVDGFTLERGTRLPALSPLRVVKH